MLHWHGTLGPVLCCVALWDVVLLGMPWTMGLYLTRRTGVEYTPAVLVWLFVGAKSLRCTLKSGAPSLGVGIRDLLSCLELESCCPVRDSAPLLGKRHRSSLKKTRLGQIHAFSLHCRAQGWNYGPFLE